jgi:hypothetical protein
MGWLLGISYINEKYEESFLCKLFLLCTVYDLLATHLFHFSYSYLHIPSPLMLLFLLFIRKKSICLVDYGTGDLFDINRNMLKQKGDCSAKRERDWSGRRRRKEINQRLTRWHDFWYLLFSCICICTRQSHFEFSFFFRFFAQFIALWVINTALVAFSNGTCCRMEESRSNASWNYILMVAHWYFDEHELIIYYKANAIFPSCVTYKCFVHRPNHFIVHIKYGI